MDASGKKTKAVKAIVTPLAATTPTGLDQRLLQFVTASATQQDRGVVQSFAPDTVVNTVRFEATPADSTVVIPKPSQFTEYFARMLTKDHGFSVGGGVVVPPAKLTNFDHVEWLYYGTPRNWIPMLNPCHLWVCVLPIYAGDLWKRMWQITVCL